MLLQRLSTYLRAIPTLLGSVRGVGEAVRPLLSLVGRTPFLFELRQPPLSFLIRSPLQAWVVKEICLDRCYMHPDFSLGSRATVIDIGASFGPFALEIARRFPEARVLAYEPFPGSFSLLKENIALNRIDNIQAHHLAVAAAPGRLGLHLSGNDPVLFSTATSGSQSIEVEATSLDAILAEQGIDRCDLLKIDCEGCEYEVLLGASPETLARVKYVSLEYHDDVGGYTHHHLVQHLLNHGFRVSRSPIPYQPATGYVFAFQPSLE